jgi:hypothetical protein
VQTSGQSVQKTFDSIPSSFIVDVIDGEKQLRPTSEAIRQPVPFPILERRWRIVSDWLESADRRIERSRNQPGAGPAGV